MTIDRNQPKFRSQSLDLTEKAESQLDSNLPKIKKIAASSVEQLTREPISFYPLASGGHARIFAAKLSDQEYIIKKGITSKDQQDLSKEKEVLQALSNSTHVVDIVPEGISIFTGSAEDEKAFLQVTANHRLSDENSLVLKRVNGLQLNIIFQQLENALAAGILSIKDYLNALTFLFKDMLLGLHDIQQKGFIHGDLKPNNILYDTKLKKAVIIDFGTTVKKDEFLSPGHESYASPEAISGMLGKKVHASYSDDLWSVGQIFYETLNSLLHNKELKFLTDFVANEASYSDRIGHIAGLIAVQEKYKQEVPLQAGLQKVEAQGSFASEAAEQDARQEGSEGAQAGVLPHPSDIYTPDIVDSPVGHAIQDFESFSYFNQELQPIFSCLEGIFSPRVEDRISLEQALAIFDSSYQPDNDKAASQLAELKSSIALDAERMRAARAKYQVDSKPS